MIVLDIETTGVNEHKNSLISIAALELENPSNQFYGECRPWEGAEITDKALKINGFTRAQLASQQKSHAQLVKEFLAWTKPIKNKTIAGHNVWFDTIFLKAALLREGLIDEGFHWMFGRRYVDVHAIAYEHFARQGKLILNAEGISAINLDKILEFLGIQVRGGYRNALEDAQLTAEVLSRLVYGKPLGIIKQQKT